MAGLGIVISWWIFPLVSSLMWLSMLFSLFFLWYTEGKPRLPSMSADQHIAYISDTGAFRYKPLFIAGSVVTVVCLDIGFFAERWLRHTGRLAKNTSWTQKIMSILSLLFALAGAAGLITLSILDTYHHPHAHDIGLGIFIIGYIISAIFLCIEYQRLGIHYRNHRILAISFWIKLFFIIAEIILAVIFISFSATKNWNMAAIFEWIVALVFTFYVMSFIVDLLPSVRTESHLPQGHKDMVMAESGVAGPRFSQTSTTYEQNLTTDSAGPNQPESKFVPEGSVPPRRKGMARLFSNLA